MRRVSLVAVAATLASLAVAVPASAIDNVNSKQLRKAVTLGGVLEHERHFQAIGSLHGDRAATFPGYDASVDYVRERLEAAGYEVKLDSFQFARWELNAPSTIERTDPSPTTWVEDTDYIVSQFSASGNVTAEVFVAGSTEVPPTGEPGTSVSGCDPADFEGAEGKIALIQRGTCPFVQKYANAEDAGAVAALIFNDGFPEREEPLFITAPQGFTIPAAMISNDIGEELFDQAQAGVVTLHVAVDATTTPIEQFNVLADTPGNPDRTIVVGAHLDSVEGGPGINDNGSGSATILEIAEEMAELPGRKPRNRVRFAWWGAEEAGLVGSTAYVESLSEDELARHEANLNFDMVGSPNFVRFVYDGDLSDSEPPPSGAPDGSAEIEEMFLRYFDRERLATDPTAFDGRSDYGPFIENGVAAGGLFTGAEGTKTPEQEALYGGSAGLAYDPCYHQPCDTFANLSHQALDEMSDAAAHATFTLARSKSPITQGQGERGNSGKGKGKGRARALPFAGPLSVR